MNSLVRIDWMPDQTRLRRFGWFGVAGFLLIGGVVSLLATESGPLDVWIVFGTLALACGLFAVFSPTRLKPIYLLAMSLAFVVTLPLALVLGMFGHDFSGPAAPPESSEPGDFGGNAGNIPEDGSSEG